MTKSKNTKRALLASVLSMMLCVAMLIGSTFAWFTDTVTSGKNKIVAGNLDVELLYSKTMEADSWETVEGAKDLFSKSDWEPGHADVVYLKVVNKGSLVLDYDLTMMAEDTVIGQSVVKDENGNPKEIRLSTFLKYGIKENVTEAYTEDDAGRQKAIADVAATEKALNEGYQTAEPVQLAAGAETPVMALVVYMPGETTGNEANHLSGTAAPEIELSVLLRAKQSVSESDSFSNDYDAATNYPKIPVIIDTTVKANVYSATDTVLKDNKVMVTIPAGALNDGVVTLSVKMKEYSENSVTYEINVVDEKGTPVTSTKQIIVDLEIGTGLKNVQVNHKGKPMDSADYSYNSKAGVVTIKTTSFSPFEIMFERTNAIEVTTVEDLQKAIEEGGDVQITESMTYAPNNNTPVISVAGKVDFGGNTLTINSASGRNGVMGTKDATLTLSNGTIKQDKIYGSSYPVVHANKGTVVLDKMDISLTESGYVVCAGSDGGKLIIKNSTITGIGTNRYAPALSVSSQASAEVEDSTINGYISVANNGVAILTNCTVKGFLYQDNGKIYINGGDYTNATFDKKVTVFAGTFTATQMNMVTVATGCVKADNGDGTFTVSIPEGYKMSYAYRTNGAIERVDLVKD